MRVVLDVSCRVPEAYVEISTGTNAEGWGMILAHIAYAMTLQHSNYLETDREDGDLFAGICDGFLEALLPKTEEEAAASRARMESEMRANARALLQPQEKDDRKEPPSTRRDDRP